MTNRDDYGRDYGRNIGREDDYEGDYGRGARQYYAPNDRARYGREEDYGTGPGRGADYGPGPARGADYGPGPGRGPDYGPNPGWDGDYGRGYGRERGPSGERFGPDYRQPGSAQAGLGPRGSAAEDWRVPGPHTGRGPRDYRRSDERIEEDVNERLTQHGQIDASDISVSVSNGEVTLQGTVDSRQAKRMAEDVAESVSGVQDVHNHLRLRQREQGGPPQAPGMAGGRPTPEQGRQRMPEQAPQGGQQQPDRAQAPAGGRAAPEQVRQGMPEQGQPGGQQQPDRAQAMAAGRTAQPEQSRPGGPGQGAGAVPPIREGMEVVGMDEVGLGHVQEVRSGEFVLNRGTQPALAVPYTFIHELTGDCIRLKVRANQLDEMRSSGSGAGM